MADAYGFSKSDASRIGRAVSKVEGDGGGAGIGSVPREGRGRPKVWGKLDGTLSPGGTATMSVWTVDPAGGLDSDTGRNITVVDADLIPLDVTVPSGTPCSAYYYGSCYVLDGYRCTN